MKSADLYSRQRKLMEVGEEGQRRLESWRLRLPQLFEGSVEALELYGNRCGMQGPVDTNSICSALPRSLVIAFHHGASRALGLGAAAALNNVLDALKLDGPRPASAQGVRTIEPLVPPSLPPHD